MMQQINLYRPIFRKQEKKFSATAMAQAGAAIFAGVVVLYALMFWQVRDLRQEVAKADKQLQSTTKRLEEASSKYGPGKGKSAENEIAELEKQLAGRLRVRDLLSRGLFSNTTGYSDFFVAFARQHVPGMWLTGFDITGAGEELRLQGCATNAAEVPRYVQRLAAEQVLNGKEFQVFVLSRPEKKEGQQVAVQPHLEFTLKTAPQKEPGKSS